MIGLNINKPIDFTPLGSNELIIGGNVSINDFNGQIQLNSNATEYYGCDTVLKDGVYDSFELPYRNRSTTSGTSFLYGIILDQNDNKIAYKRLDVTSGGTSEGSFVITFDTPVTISTSGIYQIVIGRRNWNGGVRRSELFHTDMNSSDGRVWVAYGSSNPSLQVNDTSNINWSNITKQNFNRIPQNLIYKS